MPVHGVTPTGFVLKTLAEIRADIVASLESIQDPNSGEYLTPGLLDENDPLIQVLNAHADSISKAWEQLQLAYNQFDPLKATGAGLSGLVQLNGLRKRAGTKSTCFVILTGTPFLVVPAGKTISDDSGLKVFVLPETTIEAGGTVTVQATAQDFGATTAVAGTLIKIVSPVSGWSGVTNSVDAIPGTNEETDAELLVRQQASTANTGRSTIEDKYSAIRSLDGVTHAKVYQNRTMVTDVRGIPGKAIAVVVVGGDDNEIADAMFPKLGDGVDTFGTTTKNITDIQGIVYPVSFSRPAEIDIYVDVTITIIEATLWPVDGEAQIKAAILNYAANGAGGLGITSGFDRNGFVPGEDVIASEFYTPINSIPGLQINSVFVENVSPATQATHPIAWNEVSAFDSSRIDITILP